MGKSHAMAKDRRKVIPLSSLLMNASFANAVVSAFSAKGINFSTSISSAKVSVSKSSVFYGGGRYIKYGVGSGSITA